jgi:hypothetical protein
MRARAALRDGGGRPGDGGSSHPVPPLSTSSIERDVPSLLLRATRITPSVTRGTARSAIRKVPYPTAGQLRARQGHEAARHRAAHTDRSNSPLGRPKRRLEVLARRVGEHDPIAYRRRRAKKAFEHLRRGCAWRQVVSGPRSLNFVSPVGRAARILLEGKKGTFLLSRLSCIIVRQSSESRTSHPSHV